MEKMQKMVKEFHLKFGALVLHRPSLIDEDTIKLRKDLITEEQEELYEAMDMGDLTEIADGIGDLLYVVYGTAVSYGIDMEPILEEIHRSNMTKIGGQTAENGKYLKPANFSPPQISRILLSQMLDTGLRPGASLPRASEEENPAQVVPAVQTKVAVMVGAGRKPVAYTESEGSVMLKWSGILNFASGCSYKCKDNKIFIPFTDNFDNNDVNGIWVHSILFDDGSRYDPINGWINAE